MNLNLLNDSPYLVLFNSKTTNLLNTERNAEEMSYVTFKGFIEVFVSCILI